jgi:hypothetical protein
LKVWLELFELGLNRILFPFPGDMLLEVGFFFVFSKRNELAVFSK